MARRVVTVARLKATGCISAGDVHHQASYSHGEPSCHSVYESMPSLPRMAHGLPRRTAASRCHTLHCPDASLPSRAVADCDRAGIPVPSTAHATCYASLSDARASPRHAMAMGPIHPSLRGDRGRSDRFSNPGKAPRLFLFRVSTVVKGPGNRGPQGCPNGAAMRGAVGSSSGPRVCVG
jgi:hypothetical protein